DDVFTRLARRLDGEPGPAPVLRLSDGFLTDVVWDEGLGVALDNLLLAFSRLSEGAAMIADRLSLDDPSERRAQLVGELRGVVRRLDAAAAGLTATLRPPAAGPAAVRWLERRGRKTPNVSLAAVPLDLAPILKENLFDRIESVVLTSATLAAGGDFGYLEERLGLDLPPARTKLREIHAPPFDYASQCLFGIPTGPPARPRAGPAAQGGIRAPGPRPRGRGGGRAAGPPRGYEALRRDDPRRLASGDAAGGPLGGCAGRLRRVLCATRYWGRRTGAAR